MLRTAEFVTPKHPDKLCDINSDRILDQLVTADPNARVAVETSAGHNMIFVTGEVTTTAEVDYWKITRETFKDNPKANLIVNIAQQSPEIARGVNTGGAGDQGTIVGYACYDTENYMPLEYELARGLAKYIYSRHSYDGKTQVTVDEGAKITHILASFQNTSFQELQEAVREWATDNNLDISNTTIMTNPAGDWSVGGIEADAGLTGRKIVVDAYGARVAVGGGAYSGKDLTKVDRSGAYYARRKAVQLLKEHPAKEVYVNLAYAIGVVTPIQATALIDGIEHTLDPIEFTPSEMIKSLQDIKSFAQLAEWGHYGRSIQ